MDKQIKYWLRLIGNQYSCTTKFIGTTKLLYKCDNYSKKSDITTILLSYLFNKNNNHDNNFIYL